MVKCTFCGLDRPGHRGVHLITNDGSVHFYCSSKCKANALKLKRDKRKTRWADAFHVAREKARVKAKENAEKEKEKAMEEKESQKEPEEEKKDIKEVKAKKKK